MSWFAGTKKRGTAEDTAAQNVDMYLTRLGEVNTRQHKLNIRADATVSRARKGANDETSRLLRQIESEASGNKDTYIDLKKSAKRSIDLIPDEAEQKAALSKLEEIKETFRKIRVEYKEIGVAAAAGIGDRDELLRGGQAGGAFIDPGAQGGGGDPNSAKLNQAQHTATQGVEKLKQGLNELNQAEETGIGVMGVLEEDRARIDNINRNLDTIESDLVISQRLITNLLKRLYTDKIIIAITCLIVTGVVAIIIYSSVEPQQDSFSVPDQAKPPVPSTRMLRGEFGPE